MNKLGKWTCNINHTLYKGKAFATVEPGEPYVITLNIDSPYFPKVHFTNIEETDDTMDVTAKIDMFPVSIKAHIDFDGDNRFKGIIHVPFIGEIKLEDGVKMTDAIV